MFPCYRFPISMFLHYIEIISSAYASASANPNSCCTKRFGSTWPQPRVLSFLRLLPAPRDCLESANQDPPAKPSVAALMNWKRMKRHMIIKPSGLNSDVMFPCDYFEYHRHQQTMVVLLKRAVFSYVFFTAKHFRPSVSVVFEHKISDFPVPDEFSQTH